MINEKWLDEQYYDAHIVGFWREYLADAFRPGVITNTRLRMALRDFPKGYRFTIGMRNVGLIHGAIRRGEGCVYTCTPALYYGTAMGSPLAYQIMPRDEYGRMVDTSDIAAWLRGLMLTMYCSAHHALRGSQRAVMGEVVTNGLWSKAVKKALVKVKAAFEKEEQRRPYWYEERTLRNEAEAQAASPESYSLPALVVLQEFVDWYDKWDADGAPINIDAWK